MSALRWPNVERAVIGHLEVALPAATVYSELPANGLPAEYVQVTRTGGGGDLLVDQEVDVETVVTASTRGAMWDLAADVETAMRGLAAGATPGGVYVDDVRLAFAFADDPPADQSRRRATATFTLTVRPTRA